MTHPSDDPPGSKLSSEEPTKEHDSQLEGADHKAQQRHHFEDLFHRTRDHINSDDQLVRWLVRWRLTRAIERLKREVPSVDSSSTLLVLCAGEGLEGSILCDLGFDDVTVSDLTTNGVEQALLRDQRLKGLVLDAEKVDLPDNTFDLVIVQDGLHHLQNPVLGFIEMLRVSSKATFFLEPHDSISGRVFGQTWERSGTAVNYVFRWDRKLVTDVAASYLGENTHINCSFAFWHHNERMLRLGQLVGGGARAVRLLDGLKRIAPDRIGNQFCGMVVHG